MRKTVHNLTACAFAILTSLITYANHNEILPQDYEGDTLPKEKHPDSIPVNNKVCSCRLVQVKSDSYDQQLVGIFAEKTISGKVAGNYKILRYYIEREKSIFKFYFLESLRKRKTYSNKGTCRQLYKELKKVHTNLVLYNIIDVDALISSR